VSQSLPPQLGARVVTAAMDSFIRSLNLTAYIGVGIAILAAVFTIAKLRHVSYAEQQPEGAGDAEPQRGKDVLVEPAREPVTPS
jgi:hypothetical protein